MSRSQSGITSRAPKRALVVQGEILACMGAFWGFQIVRHADLRLVLLVAHTFLDTSRSR